MARARRRSTRSSAATSSTNANNARASGSSPLSSVATTPEPDEQDTKAAAAAAASTSGLDNSCPGCIGDSSSSLNQFEKENWIACDVCKQWYHWRCAVEDKTLSIDKVDKWFCPSCLSLDPTRQITFKAPTRRSDRKRNHQDYANMSLGMTTDPSRWQRLLESKAGSFKPERFKRMHGSQVNLEWLEDDDDAMTAPIVIETKDGLGMKMPKDDLTVRDVANLVGEDVPVEVIDVANQSGSPGWSLRKWADYIELEPSARERIFNVISLEVSGTKLGDMVLPPKLVRDLDWVDNFWPSTRKGKGHAYPKVQLYCLMGVENAWTDWHVDFAGSSVYYHILSGSKVFYFIKPTPANLAAYEKWSGTELQSTWLGDMVDEVVKVVLTAGNTMIIPSGWIHAVYTPMDTIVFGGNFIHSYSVPMQLKIRQIEISTHVPKKFRFPLFAKLCWYVGDKYLRDLKGTTAVTYPVRVLTSLLALADFLVSEVRLLERSAVTEQVKKEVREQIPSDRIKDAAAMARELRWRVRLAAGNTSDDEGASVKPNGAGVKRKRGEEDFGAGVKFKNFKPRRWDSSIEQAEEEEPKVVHAPRPGEEWKEHWTEWSNGEGEGDEVRVKRRTETIIRVRKTADGLERQRIHREAESWAWW
uniref:JmjC domain-containing histone demethylation protein 1 n=1 Tax=Mycena chlorophos TaxID=658473 RepID=A0ABQ0M2S0_MYCCL|nr:jumonji superfamily protein [Mycena chlorophos]